ncbi:hypothetical protein A1O1_06768 [Capronia coronata CBS 617.96]|uniref:Aconitase X catalytic domain-containing protein n=1 Tax=Capronia coronata CBS 617.96 TaxID=1182541 RepID=W9YLK0_9EURO|nr:uncharacterized protein A1O1_06768 [Capronia coronata CBS 617.96]EXJ83149.1 hypothetical protein A1O1_06768 [Capronia coronata CBS 617.96]
MTIQCRSLVAGAASGDLLVSDVALSFWGGIDADTGIIVDQHHPLKGECIAGRVFGIPAGRGSCTGSGVLLELLLRKRGPAALVFQHVDQILTLGVIVAKAMFGVSIPVVVISSEDFRLLSSGRHVAIVGSELSFDIPALDTDRRHMARLPTTISSNIKLSLKDRAMLAGEIGLASKLAMEILVSMAEMQGARSFLDVSQAHIDACIYIGPASLEFAERFRSLDARFAVPTTLNSISIDQRRWREIGMDATLAVEAQKLAQAYMSMGAAMSFTCAPYLLDTAPTSGENIGWAESNAVVFANSVLGARTQKYPDFLDVCIALTGRAPAAGCHLDEHRLPKLRVDVSSLSGIDDAFWPLLGYHVGKLTGPDIPMICGLEHLEPHVSDLKAFGAAFATTGSAPMFHILGVTPEADEVAKTTSNLPSYQVNRAQLRECWKQLNTAKEPSLGLVSLGNPHFSLEEFETLAARCSTRRKHPDVAVVVTTSRAVCEQALTAGYLDSIQAFGAGLITDTCWCMLGEPVVPLRAKNIMTNSGKYAHYAPGMVMRGVHFASLSSCIDAACSGQVDQGLPAWLCD